MSAAWLTAPLADALSQLTGRLIELRGGLLAVDHVEFAYFELQDDVISACRGAQRQRVLLAQPDAIELLAAWLQDALVVGQVGDELIDNDDMIAVALDLGVRLRQTPAVRLWPCDRWSRDVSMPRLSRTEIVACRVGRPQLRLTYASRELHARDDLDGAVASAALRRWRDLIDWAARRLTQARP